MITHKLSFDDINTALHLMLGGKSLSPEVEF